ncbi:MAG: HAD family hydrolase [Sciscionella sp.]
MTPGLPRHSATEIDTSAGSGEVGAVCLDVDDTLVDYQQAVRAALRAALGSDDSWPVWQQVADDHVAKVISGELDRASMPLRRTRAFLAAIRLPLDDVDAMCWERERLARMGRCWALFHDVLPCLDWLRASGLRIAAVTNASGPHQREKLVNLGIAGFFDNLLIAGEIGAAKPDPVMFHTACVRLGLSPAQVVHVGDRLDLDAVGATNAGLHGVWLDRHGHGGECAAVAAGVRSIGTLGELPELLVGELSLVVR